MEYSVSSSIALREEVPFLKHLKPGCVSCNGTLLCFIVHLMSHKKGHLSACLVGTRQMHFWWGQDYFRGKLMEHDTVPFSAVS